MPVYTKINSMIDPKPYAPSIQCQIEVQKFKQTKLNPIYRKTIQNLVNMLKPAIFNAKSFKLVPKSQIEFMITLLAQN